MDGGTDIEVDDLELVVQLGAAGEGAAGAAPGVEAEGSDRPAFSLDPPVELLNAGGFGEIDPDRFDARRHLAQLARSRLKLLVLCRDQKVEPFAGEDLRQLEADPAGSAGDHREIPCRFHRGFSLWFFAH